MPCAMLGYLISNAKTSAFASPPLVGWLRRDRQMSNECQSQNPKLKSALLNHLGI
jgi:hypothetical protein